MFGIIVFVQVADDHSFTGAGMNKLTVFEVNAYMSYFIFWTTAGEEYQVSFPEIPFGDFIAFFF